MLRLFIRKEIPGSTSDTKLQTLPPLPFSGLHLTSQYEWHTEIKDRSTLEVSEGCSY